MSIAFERSSVPASQLARVIEVESRPGLPHQKST